jgi:hypothetical protein
MNDERWQRRTDRILLALAEQAGLVRMSLGPMDPAWRERREQVQVDLSEILAEQAEPELEVRSS